MKLIYRSLHGIAHRVLHWRTIGIRLLLSFLIIILLSGVIGLLAAQHLSQLTSTIKELNTRDLPELFAIGRLRTALFQQRTLTREAVLPDEPNRNASITSLRASTAEVAHDWATLQSLKPIYAQSPTSPDAQLARSLMESITQNDHLLDRLISFLQQHQIAQAQALEARQIETNFTRALSATSRWRTFEQAEASAATVQAQQDGYDAIHMTLALTMLALVLSIALAALITRSLTHPLRALVQATNALASGNLNARAPELGSAEFARLAQSFNSMGDNLRSTISSLARQRSETQAILDTATDGMMVADDQRRVLQMNPAAERLTGWSSEQAPGHHCWEIFSGYATASMSSEELPDTSLPKSVCSCGGRCPLAAALCGEQPKQVEMLASGPGQERRWLSISCAQIPHETHASVQRVVVGLHDITQLKRVEEMKSDFVAMVSHELRSPLTTVSGSVEMLGQIDPTNDREMYMEVIAILQQQTQRLRNVVDEVLVLTRLDADHLHIRPQKIALIPFLQQLLNDTRADWIGNGHTVHLLAPDEHLGAWMDVDLLRLVMRNLLDNARTYAPERSPVTVEVRRSQNLPQVEVRVCDEGVGIAPNMRERIFERFVRGNTSPQESRGYGLGLYIAHQILQAHHQTIWIDAKHPGTCFAFSLNVTEAEETAVAAPEQRSGGDGALFVPLVGIEAPPSHQALLQGAIANEHNNSDD